MIEGRPMVKPIRKLTHVPEMTRPVDRGTKMRRLWEKFRQKMSRKGIPPTDFLPR